MSAESAESAESNNITVSFNNDFVHAVIRDVDITVDIAKDVLTQAGELCLNNNCNRVLTESINTTRKTITPTDACIVACAVKDFGFLPRTRFAFVTPPERIGEDTEFMELVFANRDYFSKFFPNKDKEKALKWLLE